MNSSISPPGHMRMFSGQLVDPLNLRPEQVRFDDICWALGNICRYGGHCHRHYSVAEHTLDVHRVIKMDSLGGPDGPLFALLHDCAEAYVGDVPAPIKDRLGIDVIEREVQSTICTALGFSSHQKRAFFECITDGPVKKVDIEAGNWERGFLWQPPTALWQMEKSYGLSPASSVFASRLLKALREEFISRGVNTDLLGIGGFL